MYKLLLEDRVGQIETLEMDDILGCAKQRITDALLALRKARSLRHLIMRNGSHRKHINDLARIVPHGHIVFDLPRLTTLCVHDCSNPFRLFSATSLVKFSMNTRGTHGQITYQLLETIGKAAPLLEELSFTFSDTPEGWVTVPPGSPAERAPNLPRLRRLELHRGYPLRIGNQKPIPFLSIMLGVMFQSITSLALHISTIETFPIRLPPGLRSLAINIIIGDNTVTVLPKAGMEEDLRPMLFALERLQELSLTYRGDRPAAVTPLLGPFLIALTAFTTELMGIRVVEVVCPLLHKMEVIWWPLELRSPELMVPLDWMPPFLAMRRERVPFELASDLGLYAQVPNPIHLDDSDCRFFIGSLNATGQVVTCTLERAMVSRHPLKRTYWVCSRARCEVLISRRLVFTKAL